jgi:tetratricopeptide (TPR) repeat protein
LDYAAAEALLEQARGRTPDDPDVHSLLGFCARKLGRLGESYAHYQRALGLDPGHLGAREYLGELHLRRGEPDRARAQLAELARLCPRGCEERDELAQAIQAYGTAPAP